MKIRCIHCGEYFFLDEETLELMTEGYISSDTVNTWQLTISNISNNV